MHPTSTFSFTRELEDGSLLEISMAFRFTRNSGGQLQVAVTDVAAEPRIDEVDDSDTIDRSKRLTKETDVQYLQRLISMGEAEPRILARWAKLLNVSLRALNKEKRSGRIKYVEKGHTRAGNAHLVTSAEVMKTLLRLSGID